MNIYNINKGIGRTVEFKGLKVQYLFLFAGGLLGILILIVILYMTGINSYVCLFIGIGGGSLLVWQTFSLNKKYGEHGLMKVQGIKEYPGGIFQPYTKLLLIKRLGNWCKIR